MSQSWWAKEAVRRFAADAWAAHGSAKQIYARQIFGHLRLGLGLAIVRQVAEAHGGSVSAENAEGGGSRFSLRLPSAISELPPEPATTG